MQEHRRVELGFINHSNSLAYADDIDIIARSQTALKEAFLSLERAAGEMGLRINKKKTKYLTTREKVKINRVIFRLRIIILKLHRILHNLALLEMLIMIILQRLRKES